MKPYILICLFFISFIYNAQVINKDSNTVKENYKLYCIIQNDGTKLIGKIIESNPREVSFKTTDGRDIIVPQYIIKSISEVKTDDFNINGEYVGKDNFCTRYFLTTNGLPLEKGKNYTQWNLFGPDFQFSVSDHLGMGVMTSWIGIPIIGTIKYSNKINDYVHYAVGGLIGTGAWAAPEFGGALPFASITFGTGKSNVSISGGYGAIWNNGSTSGRSIVSVAGMSKIGKKISLIFDSFIMLPGASKTYYNYGYPNPKNQPGFAIFVTGFRLHQTETSAFQFGFGGVMAYNKLLPVPIPLAQWFRSF